jgi:hypothetical protein
MTDHARAAELAALNIDFGLTAAEQMELNRHLAVCGPCNDVVAAYRADAEALRSQAFAQAPERVRAAVQGALTSPAPRARFRTDLLIAAALLGALLVAGLVAAGAFRPRDELVVAPVPTATAVAEAAPSPTTATPEVTAGATSSPAPATPEPTKGAVASVQLPVGIHAMTVTDRLFIRSKPGVEADSTKLQVLDTGTTFKLVEGPVSASGYWWYRVDDVSVPLAGGTSQGWVAAADHDGTPWIGPSPDSCVDYQSQFSPGAITVHSLAELQIGILGTWAGCVRTPWVPPYWVTLTFKGDGTYAAMGDTKADGYQYPAFYYGTDGESPTRTYALNDLQDSLKGVGQIDIVFDDGSGSIVRDELRNIKLMGDRLEFEFFHFSQYGPVTFRLYRIETPT